MPPILQQALFNMKQGEVTEQETPDGFVIAVLTDIQEPDPKQEPAVYAEVRDRLNRETADDVGQIFANALRARTSTRVNRSVFEQVAQP
jgi:parvulin-like peptidyl-prolyl isomerase